MHTVVDTVVALLEGRAQGTLTVTKAAVWTSDGSHPLYQAGMSWRAVGPGHSSHVPDWLAEFLYPLLAESLRGR